MSNKAVSEHSEGITLYYKVDHEPTASHQSNQTRCALDSYTDGRNFFSILLFPLRSRRTNSKPPEPASDIIVFVYQAQSS